MKNKIDVIKQLIEECGEADRRTWPDETRTVLEAFAQARNSVSWQIRDTIAKAFLENANKASGWTVRAAGKVPSEFILENKGSSARILIKREFPRLCRGGSRSLTYSGVAPETPRREPPSARQGETGWMNSRA